MKLLHHNALTRLPESGSSTHFQGKYFRPAFREDRVSAGTKLLAGEMDQAALKLKYRIQHELPPEIEIHFVPENRGDKALYLYQKNPKTGRLDSFGVLNSKGKLSNISWVQRNLGESCEAWLNRVIDEVKKAIPLNQEECLAEIRIQEKELAEMEATKLESERQKEEIKALQGWVTPWLNVSSVFPEVSGEAKAKALLETFNQNAQRLESLLLPELTLTLSQNDYGDNAVYVEVNRRVSSERFDFFKPTGFSTSEHRLDQKCVPRYGGVLSLVPFKKLESEAAFVKRVIKHIETLIEREAMVERFNVELDKAKRETNNNFEMRNREFLYYQGWDASMKMLATLKEYSTFFQKLDPRLFLEYNANYKDREYIHIEYQEASGQRFSLLGAKIEDGYTKSMIYRKRKQTPDQFLMTVFQTAKALLPERQRIDKLLETVEDQKDFSV
jgi:hypothetical protein